MERCDVCRARHVFFSRKIMYASNMKSRCRDHLPHPKELSLLYLKQNEKKLTPLYIDCCLAIIQEAELIPGVWMKCTDVWSDGDLLIVLDNVVNKRYSNFDDLDHTYTYPKRTLIDHLRALGFKEKKGVMEDILHGKYEH